MATEEHGNRERGKQPKQSRPHPEGKRRPRPKSSGQQEKRPPQRRRRKRRRRRRTITPAALAMSAIVIVLALVGFASALGKGSTAAQKPARAETNVSGQEASQQGTSKAPGTVSFCAVGDNIIGGEGDTSINLLKLGNTWGGGKSGSYDFSPLYAKMKDTISSYDIAFINQETVLAGGDNGSYSGYPSYNTPDEVASAIKDAGFDVVNFNSNHSYDMGAKGIEHAQKTWAKQDGVTLLGSYTSADDRKDIRVLERNGVKIAFLSYCCGLNDSEQGTSTTNDYYAVPFDKEKAQSEIKRAKELADAVVVYMHWGDSFTTDITDEQVEYGRFLAGQGVDLTIGSHADVIQTVSYVNRGIPTTDGSGANAYNGMLCVYGLGDFVSGSTVADRALGGMFTCEFVRDDRGEITVANPVWHGIIEHAEGDTDTVYLLKDYNESLAKKNKLLEQTSESESSSTSNSSSSTNPLEWAKKTTKEVVGDEISVEV